MMFENVFLCMTCPFYDPDADDCCTVNNPIFCRYSGSHSCSDQEVSE